MLFDTADWGFHELCIAAAAVLIAWLITSDIESTVIGVHIVLTIFGIGRLVHGHIFFSVTLIPAIIVSFFV